jgi:hypothetical protein
MISIRAAHRLTQMDFFSVCVCSPVPTVRILGAFEIYNLQLLWEIINPDTLVSWRCVITGLSHQTYSAIQKKQLRNIYFKSADGHNVLAKKEIGSMDEFLKKTLATYSDTLKFRKQTCELKPRQGVLHPACNQTYTSQWNHKEMFHISVALWDLLTETNQAGAKRMMKGRT